MRPKNLCPCLLHWRIVYCASIPSSQNRILPYLRPDGKTQVTVEYVGDEPVRVDTVVISAQHKPDIPLEHMRHEIIEEVIKQVLPEGMFDSKTRFC